MTRNYKDWTIDITVVEHWSFGRGFRAQAYIRKTDGTYPDEADTKSWARECAQHFIDGEGEMDNPEAECLMQIIMFGDVIY